jgi:hypothetical protein
VKFASWVYIHIDSSLNYNKIRNKAEQFKALTAVSVEAFDELLSIFSAEWLHFIKKFNLDGSIRYCKQVPKAHTH